MLGQPLWGNSGSGATGAGGLQAQSQTEVLIAATTDVHGRLRGWDYYANAADPGHSLAAAATIVDSLRRANPDGVVLVEGGDILQGNPLTYVAARVRPTPVHPVIAEITSRLLGVGAATALMSGSGSGVFAAFKSVRAAEAARRRLERSDWRMPIVESRPCGVELFR